MPVIASRAAASLKSFGHMVSSGISIARDAFFNMAGLLLKGNAGDPLDTIKEVPPPLLRDFSTNKYTATIGGTAKTSKLNPFNGNYYSYYYDGSSSTDFALSTSGACAFGTGDFTVEFWVYPLTAPNNNWSPFLTIGNSGGGQELRFSQNINGTGWGWLYPNTGSSADNYAGYGTLTLGRWHHIATARSGTTYRLFLNGAVIATDTNATFNFTNTTLFRLGQPQPAYPDGSTNCYIHGLRIVKGTALYTSAFIPPTSTATAVSGTTVFLANSAQFKESINNLAVTLNTTPKVTQFVPFETPSTYLSYGSVALNGSTDYLSYPSSNNWSLGTDDFTIECWVYLTVAGGGRMVTSRMSGGGANGTWSMAFTSTSLNFTEVVVGEPGPSATFTNTVLNAWAHIAVSRSGGVTKLFLNGNQIASASQTTNFSNTSYALHIGTSPTESYVTGYISNVHIVKGSALYTSSFTPATSPVTAVSNTKLLVAQFNGSDTNNTAIDRSNLAATITRAGNTTQGTFSPYVYNGSALLGGSNWLSTPSNAVLNFGTNDFTVECWVYVTSFGNGFTVWSMWDGGSSSARFTLNIGTAGADTDSGYGMGLSKTTVTAATAALNTWTHIALVRQGSTFRWYTNGVNNLVSTTSATFSPSSVTTVLGNYSSSYSTGTGYVSNIRIVNGTAVYTTNFTPSIVQLAPIEKTQLLMFTDVSFTDRSQNRLPFTINGTPTPSQLSPFATAALTQNQGNFSAFFNGSTDFYTIPSSTSLNFGTNDFTVECWAYMPTTMAGTNGKQLIEFRPDSTNGAYFALGVTITGVIGTYVNSVSQIAHQTTMQPGQWYHIAVARQSSITRMFVNGVVSTTTPSDTTSYTSSGTIKFGTNAFRSSATDTYWYGYISNVRIVNGTALYTGSFSTPAAPLTNVVNTVFLGFQNSYNTDASNSRQQLTGNGTPRITSFSPFSTQGYTVTPGSLTTSYQTGGSIYFDGTGDYLTMPAITAYDLSTTSGQWSIECWVYLTGGTTAYRTFISKRVSGTQWEIGVNPTNSYLYFYNGTVYLTNITVKNNIWTHCAVVYDGSTLRQFVDGVQGYTGAVNAASGTDAIFIGGITGATQLTTGYISDIRVIRGKITYGAGFIPPTSPLAVTGETVISIRGGLDGGIFDNTGTVNLETLGGAKVSTAVSKWGTGSIAFNGSTDYLFIPGNPLMNTGTNDWTVEAWVYLNAIPTSDAWPTNYSLHMVLMGTGSPNLGDGTDCIIGQTKLIVQINDTQYASTGVHGMVINTWYHLAYVRSSNTINFYVNGGGIGSVAMSASNGTGSGTYIGCETANGAYLNGYIDDLRFSRFARYTTPVFPLPTISFQEAGPTASDPGTSGLNVVAGDGLSSATAGASAAAIKAQTGTNIDGVYWINLPTVGPTQVYCIMNSAANGGGWMMAMKATRGTTFSYSANYWNTNNTLNPTANNRADGDAKFNTMNYFAAKDIMALWPDITTNGGGLGTNPYSCWSWLENNFNGGSTTTLINFFNTAGTFNTGDVNTAGNYGGKFIQDAKTTPNWASGTFTTQVDIRFYGFNFKNYPNGSYDNGLSKVRWGFGFNENGEGLYSSPATLAIGGYAGSNDVSGGIGMDTNRGSYSAGDHYGCCSDTNGIQRSARVEIYIR